MAIGDVWSQKMGTAETDRQPASGVAEQVSFICKQQATDPVAMWDGINERNLYLGAVHTDTDIVDSAQAGTQAYNLAVLITNTNYLRKADTTDVIYTGGVQVNA